MKKILISSIILIFILLQAAGQQSQDTLFLKDGSKVAGKLVGKSKKEYRLQSSDGMVFIFSTDCVEKFVPAMTPVNHETMETIIRKANPDTLTIDELNLYEDNAVKMRNTGMTVTFGGIGIIIGGIIGAFYFVPQDPSYIAGCILIFGAVGVATTLVGINLWAVGGSRKTKAELTLQKFNIAPQGSMALGLGLTIKF